MDHFGLKQISDTDFEGRKFLEITDFKIESVENDVFMVGYVNTKNVKDSHGHIPINYNGEPVYDLSRYSKNPVLFIDHKNSASCVAGKAVALSENETGLHSKFLFMKEPQNIDVKHAIQAAKEGLLKGFSIGGQWLFRDSKNKNHLTKAIIHEISLVGIGSDGNALGRVAKKSISEFSERDRQELAIQELIVQYRKSRDERILETIDILRRQ